MRHSIAVNTDEIRECLLSYSEEMTNPKKLCLRDRMMFPQLKHSYCMQLLESIGIFKHDGIAGYTQEYYSR